MLLVSLKYTISPGKWLYIIFSGGRLLGGTGKNYIYHVKQGKIIRKVASLHVQVALQPHESKKLNLVATEKSCDFSYAIKNNIFQLF